MKKWISLFVKIISVVLAFVLLNLLFMPKYIEENTDGRITAEYYREKTDIDVIFVGSSTVNAGISPMTMYREYGITSFDRSNPSQVMPISYAMIADSIKRNKPKLVVLDVGFLYQTDDYVDEGSSRKSMDSFKWSKIKSDCINNIMDETESFIDYVFPILRFHSRWNDLSSEDLKYWVYKPDVTYNGQLLHFENDGINKEWNPYQLDPEIKATDRTMSYLEKTANLCADNDVELLLIKMPFVEGNWNDSIEAQIVEFSNAHSLNYVNYIESFSQIGLEMYEFSDGQHMNSYGAEKFTKVLGKYIIDNYSVSSRTDDAKIKAVFDEKLEKYEEEMSKEH